jgi:hypothetical protein
MASQSGLSKGKIDLSAFLQDSTVSSVSASRVSIFRSESGSTRQGKEIPPIAELKGLSNRAEISMPSNYKRIEQGTREDLDNRPL